MFHVKHPFLYIFFTQDSTIFSFESENQTLDFEKMAEYVSRETFFAIAIKTGTCYNVLA